MLAYLKILVLFLFSISSLTISCNDSKEEKREVGKEEVPISNTPEEETETEAPIIVAAERMDVYLPMIGDKKIALLVNQTSMIGQVHLVDALKKQGVHIQKIFAPEHGFRGKADAGEQIKDGKDAKTGIPVFSLYGKTKKPSPEMLADIDMVVFDIQDVGARFYTYISTMHYVMEACAENDVDFLVLDRPNPNIHYIDGPIRKKGFESFIGMHPIPIVHGMTVAEVAQMINGESWLKNGVECNLQFVKCENYTRHTSYTLPVKPSPNLPNIRSIILYPSLCLFEGTSVSIGRGTNTQFQVIGHPDFSKGNYTFTPKSMEGAKYPKHENKICQGYDLTTIDLEKWRSKGQINLDYLIEFYQNFPNKENFFLKNLFFDKLAGTDELRKQIIAGKSAEQIRFSWKSDLEEFDKMREKYLIY